MAAHWELLLKWNQKTNLTAITDPKAAAFTHYADSLAAMGYLHVGPVLDVGSGGGFPGIVLAIALPHLQFTLLEPRQKRVSFLQTVQARLALDNVRVLCGRLEDAPDQVYAHAVSRAVFSDAQMFESTAPWLASGGTMLAYRAADAPVAKTLCKLETQPYTIGGRTRRIDVWTFP
jgi:16S rRNA (guanine527-N7)-methyltransferase